MATLQVFYKLSRSNNINRSLGCTFKRNYTLDSKRSFGPTPPISNEILWRSIHRDSSIKTAPISFYDVFERTKALNRNSHQRDDIEEALITAAESQRKQSPLRVARLTTYLNNLPYGLSKTNSILSLMTIYVECYEKLTEIKPITTIQDCDEFYNFYRYFLIRQLLAIPKLCHGLLEKVTERNSLFSIENTDEYLTAFINQFASQRLATRVMSAHNVTLYDQIKNDKAIKMGLFEENCDVMKYIKQAIIDSAQDCERHFVEYGNETDYINFGQISFAPKVNCVDKRKNKIGTNFSYIPQHLHHMIFELLKNSMRAIIESEKDILGEKDSEIDIVVVDGNDGSITVKISDIGGGIPRNKRKKIWLYGYTTGYDNDNDGRSSISSDAKMIKHRELLAEIIHSADEQWEYDYLRYINNDLNLMSVLGAVKYTPMFGLGYGLPITKLYANYFGGDCHIQSIHGHGTDAYLFLNNLSNCTNIVI